MEADLELELRKLVVGTNDQRRRVGQALYHFYRTLIFWRDKGLTFTEVTRAWSAGGAMIFDTLVGTLRELGPPDADARLRAYMTKVLRRLAGDLRRGDHMLVPFLRWLETQFPEVTEMMRSEAAESRIYDLELAEQLARVFAVCAREDREGMVRVLGEASRTLAH